jgi:hypothetical protein
MTAGCLQESANDERGATAVPSTDHDHGGDYLGESKPVERIDVERISASRREGGVVYYDPDERGPYTDGQDALEDVPQGGTFVIGDGTWNVAEEGRLLVRKTVQIRGVGWSSKAEGAGGTRIVNTGDEALDRPAVEFHGPEEMESKYSPRILGSLRDVHVLHEGDAPAVRVRRAIRTVIADCSIDCRREAPTGLKYEGWGFFSRALRNKIQHATDVTVHVTGTGYGHEFYSNHIASGVDGATAFQTERNRTILVGGECAATGENGVAVKFYNPGSGGLETGGYVVEPGIEQTDRPVVIDGEMPFNSVQFHHLKMPAGGDEPLVTFGNTVNSKVFYPIIRSGEEPELVRWSEQSRHCGIITDGWTLGKDVSLTDEGAQNPHVSVTGSVTDRMLQRFPTDVPMTVEHHDRSGGPVSYDGTSWQRVTTQSFSPGDG